MHYVYQEPVISTITDDEVTDPKALQDLLTSLKDQQHTISLEYRDSYDAEIIKSLESVRITNVTADTIDIHAFFKTATARIKEIPITNLRSIRLIATKQLLAQKYKVKRWHMMDVAEVE
jgi:hypothetical protein